MALQSHIFRQNARLQSCAREHPAHILIGAHGEHVAKIQHALFELDGLAIDRTELVSQHYGPSTAAAVLAYKKLRRIVNRSYQNAEDNIVGKMTIASLDREMAQVERVPKSVSDCRLSGTGAPGKASPAVASLSFSISARAAGAVGVNTTAPRQLGGVVRINVTFASNARGDGFPLLKEIEKAKDSLFEHGMALAADKQFTGGGVFQFNERVLVNLDSAGDNVNELRKRCEDLMPGQPGVLRVIVCRLGQFDFGHTIRNRRAGNVLFPPFVLLNTEQVDRSGATLIHEMIHASKPGPVNHDPEPHSVFFKTGSTQLGSTERTFLKPEHAATISAAFFTVGGTPLTKKG